MSLLDRDYVRDAGPRLYQDPEEICFRCDGKGSIRWFDADLLFVHESCPICRGVATAGQYVVQIVTERFHHELSFQTDDFNRATARAAWVANLFGRLGGRCMGYRATEVRVAWKTTPRLAPDEVVAAYGVPLPRNPGPTAA